MSCRSDNTVQRGWSSSKRRSRVHLIMELGELNDSGHTGTAWLASDGDQTQVVIHLIEPDEMD